MPRPPRPYKSRGYFVSNVGGQRHKLCRYIDGKQRAACHYHATSFTIRAYRRKRQLQRHRSRHCATKVSMVEKWLPDY